MPIDAPVIAGLAAELNRLLPVKIDRIYQLYNDEFLFCGVGQGQTIKLLCSLNSQYGRIHLVEEIRKTSTHPSVFCHSLQKHISNSKLLRIEAVPFERIVKFTFETYEAVLGLHKKHLWIELTGKSANLILTSDNGQIIDAWRHSGQNKNREVSSGVEYELPTTGGRWKPVSIPLEQFRALLSQVPSDVTLEKFLLKHWYGLSPLSIHEICGNGGYASQTTCAVLAENNPELLYRAFFDWAQVVAEQHFSPCVVIDPDGRLTDCSALPIHFPTAQSIVKSIPSLNIAVAEITDIRHENHRFTERKRNLVQKLKQQLEKNQTKLSKQINEAETADQGDQWRVAGELLSTYGYSVPKGSRETSLMNHYDPDLKELVIPLNPALTAQENAQSFFKKYQKAKKGQLAIAIQIEKTRVELQYQESVLTLAENALTTEDLQLVEEELTTEKKPVSSRKSQTQQRKKEAPAEPRQFTSPAGHLLYIGRNNFQNDRLTFKIADPNDLWFHTQKIPGSHVILKPKPGTAIDDESLNWACQLAVYFSKAKQSTKVPVDYTQRKNVKKPPGSKPGFVIYDHFKTAIISPDQQLLEHIALS